MSYLEKERLAMLVEGLRALAHLHTARALLTYDNKVFIGSTFSARDALRLADLIKQHGAAGITMEFAKDKPKGGERMRPATKRPSKRTT